MMLRFAVAVKLSASFTCTVKLKVPKAVAVPLMAPAPLRTNPPGKVFAALVTVQV